MVEQRTDRRRFARAVAMAAAGGMALGALGLLGGCAGMMGSHDVVLSESRLMLLLAGQFPMERRVLEVVDLSVTNPQLRLLPESNRLATELDVAAQDRLFGNSAQGHVKLDYGLRFEVSDHSIRMVDLRVRDLQLASGSNALRGAAQRLGTLVAEQLLEDRPLYKMKSAQVDEMERLNLVAGPIRVTPQGLVMTVSPRGG